MPFLIERHFYLQPTMLYICVMNENLDPTNANFNPEELDLEKKLRPLSFDDFTGQEQVLDNLKVFTTSSIAISNEMKATADKYIKTAGLEELMRVNNGGKNIKILVKSGLKDSQIKELLMFIEGSGRDSQSILLSLTGDFDLDEISVLTDKMKLPGGDALKKAAKSK